MPPRTSTTLLSVSALSASIALGVDTHAFPHEASPAADFHMHHHFVRRKMKDAGVETRRLRKDQRNVVPRNQKLSADTIFDILRPSADEDNDTCPGSPFLWKIVEDSTSKHVGFALGTMHLPPSVVTTDKALTSIHNAIQDSCDVYGELNLIDEEVLEEVQSCVASDTPNTPAAATVKDIPDEELRTTIEAKIFEVATALMPERAAEIAEHLLTLPLTTILNMLLYYNTVEYRDVYLEEIRTGESVMLDTHVLKLGRPSGSLEKVSTQCKAIAEEANVLTPEILRANWDAYSVEIERMLNDNMSSLINLYKCGHGDTFRNALKGGCTGSCRSRNVQMATEMEEILKANPNERVFFAVGAAHWRLEPYSMEEVLKVYGYSLIRLESWGNTDAADLSNQQCEVVFDSEKGYYVSNAGATETSSAAPWILPNVRSASSNESPLTSAEAQQPSTDGTASSGSLTVRSSYVLFVAVLAFVGL